MSLFKRRLIFLFFLLLFVTIAPLLILFANGYRFDWQSWTVYKTGLLVVEYAPRDALLALDDVQRGTRSPERISGLSPRNYALRIEKNGYFPWEKRLWIPEYVTTFVRHVVLFKQSTPRLVTGTYVMSTMHPSEPVVAAGVQTPAGVMIDLLSPEREERLTALAPLSNLETLAWSPQGRRLLVAGWQGNKRVASVFTVSDTSAAIALDQFSALTMTRLTWDRESDDVLGGYSREGRATWLVRIDLRGETDRSLVPDAAFNQPFILDDRRLILLLPPDGGTRTSDTKSTPILFRSFTTEASGVEYQVRLPSDSENLTLTDHHPNLLTIVDPRGHAVFFVEREPRSKEPIVERFSNALDARWSPNGRRLVYWNENELFLWDLERNVNERIYRAGEEAIVNVFWHPENEYVFVQTKKTVQVLEIDGRDVRNLTTLVSSLDEILGAGLNRDGQWLWTNSAEGVKWYDLK